MQITFYENSTIQEYYVGAKFVWNKNLSNRTARTIEQIEVIKSIKQIELSWQEFWIEGKFESVSKANFCMITAVHSLGFLLM